MKPFHQNAMIVKKNNNIWKLNTKIVIVASTFPFDVKFN